MPFCTKCRTFIPDGVDVCPGCGNSRAQRSQTQTQNPPAPPPKKRRGNSFLGKLFATMDYTDSYDSQDIKQHTNIALLSYIGPLLIFPLIFARKSPYAMFHFCQGLMNTVIGILYVLFFSLISSFLTQGILPLLLILLFALTVVFPVFAVVGIVNVFAKRGRTLPWFGRIRLHKILFKNL